MSSPSSSTSPASAADGTSSCMRLRIRRNVDLPQPDGPISAVMPPAGMVSETRSSTLWVPNHAVMSTARSSARSAFGAAVAGGTAGSRSVWSVMGWLSFGARWSWWVPAGAGRSGGVKGGCVPPGRRGVAAVLLPRLHDLDLELGRAGVPVGVTGPARGQLVGAGLGELELDRGDTVLDGAGADDLLAVHHLDAA